MKPPAPRTIKVVMSERCYRFKPEALGHAPPTPGVYEFVTFDDRQLPKVVFVGLAEASLQACLADHLAGRRSPKAQDLLSKYPNVYFDYVAGASAPDWKGIADALIRKNQPELNPRAPQTTDSPLLEEVEFL